MSDSLRFQTLSINTLSRQSRLRIQTLSMRLARLRQYYLKYAFEAIPTQNLDDHNRTESTVMQTGAIHVHCGAKNHRTLLLSRLSKLTDNLDDHNRIYANFAIHVHAVTVTVTVTDSLFKHELQKSPPCGPSPFVPQLLRRPVSAKMTIHLELRRANGHMSHLKYTRTRAQPKFQCIPAL
jgi:hypothetical protein